MQMQRPDLRAEAQRGIEALQRGDFLGAHEAFSRVTRAPDASAHAWLLYAQACEGCDEWDAMVHAADRVLALDLDNPFALLMKGGFYARRSDDRAAVSFYRRAIRRCSKLDPLPGDLAQRLAVAQRAVSAAEQRFEVELEKALAERGIEQMPPRFAEALAIISGKQPVYLQEPTSFYFPGLPQQPWFESAQFPWLAELEAAVPAMCCEVERVLAEDSGLEPYVQESSERASRGHSLLNDARWSAFHLWKDGALVEENAERCPLIMRKLELAPLPFIRGRSPMALISILRPNTHIPPHSGLLNTRLICHIPLLVPPGCRLRVGSETRDVTAGNAMVFDDSIEHEAWNDGSSSRAVLLFEIWRPEISDEEKVALTAMFEAVTGYGDAQED